MLLVFVCLLFPFCLILTPWRTGLFGGRRHISYYLLDNVPTFKRCFWFFFLHVGTSNFDLFSSMYHCSVFHEPSHYHQWCKYWFTSVLVLLLHYVCWRGVEFFHNSRSLLCAVFAEKRKKSGYFLFCLISIFFNFQFSSQLLL